MAKELFVPNTDCEGDLNLLACLRVQAIDVQRPRVSVQRVYVTAPGVFALGHVQRLARLMHVVSIIEDEFAVGIMPPARLRQCFAFEIRLIGTAAPAWQKALVLVSV